MVQRPEDFLSESGVHHTDQTDLFLLSHLQYLVSQKNISLEQVAEFKRTSQLLAEWMVAQVLSLLAPPAPMVQHIEVVLPPPSVKLKPKPAQTVTVRPTRKNRLTVHKPVAEVKPQSRVKKQSTIQEVDPTDGVGQHIKDIGEYELLTHEQEILLSKLRELGVLAQEKLDASQYMLPSDIKEELIRLTEVGKEARDLLINSNTRLVLSVAKKYQGQGLSFNDLIQEGHIGLIRGTDKFNWQQGFRFSTYVTWWIRQNITREIRNKRGTIRVPVHEQDRFSQVQTQVRVFEQEHFRKPTLEELSKLTGIRKAKLEAMFLRNRRPVSLEDLVSEDGETERGDLTTDVQATDPANIELTNLQEVVAEILQNSFRYDPRTLEILQLRFGMIDGESKTLQEVAKIIGLTRERIRQIIKKALEKLSISSYSAELKKLHEESEDQE